MRRPLGVLLLVLVLVLNAGAMFLQPLARAQEATPGITAANLPQLLDLPAMVLLPEDIPQPGFGISVGQYQRADDIVAYMAPQSGVAADEILAGLQDAGFEQRYFLTLDQVAPAGTATPTGAANFVGMRIETSITEYASAKGAEAGFDLLERTLEEPMGLQDVPTETNIGDEAEITLATGTITDTQAPYQILNLTFRTGRIIADISVLDFANQPIDQAAAEALAAPLQERIASVLDGNAPDLSMRVARPMGTPELDSYLVRDGVPLPTNFVSDALLEQWTDTAGGVQDVYTSWQWLGYSPYLATWLYAFDTPEAAGEWLAAQDGESFSFRELAANDVQDVPDAPVIGDASRTFAYSLEFDPENVANGYVVYSQVGSIVARVGIHGIPEVPLSAVIELSQAQAACLEQGGCTELVALPSGLESSPPDATPVSEPVATPTALVDPGLIGPTTFAAQDGAWQVSWDPALWTPVSIDRSDGEVIVFASAREASASVTIGLRESFEAFRGDADTCIDKLPDQAVAGNDTIRDFAPVLDGEGTPVARVDASGNSRTFQFVEMFEDGTEDTFLATFSCRTVTPGESVLASLATVNVRVAAQTAPDIEALLDGIVISPEGQE